MAGSEPDGLPLEEIVGRANRIFSESTAANAFATLVAGRLNGGGALELVNAGHNPPLLVQESSVTALAAASLPFGFSARTNKPSHFGRILVCLRTGVSSLDRRN